MTRTDPPSSSDIAGELQLHREELATQNEELRRANASLVAAREHFSLLYEVAPIGYFTLDQQGTILQANIAAEQLVERPRAFLVGRPFEELIATSMRESFRRFRAEAMADGRRLVHETALALATRRVPARMEAGKLVDSSGLEQCVLCVTDETARAELEAQRRQAASRVAEEHRRESLDTLAGGIAHDFNNLLAMILSYADLLLLEDTAPPRLLEHARALRATANRAATLSRQMGSYTGKMLSRREPLDLSAGVRAHAEALTKVASGVHIRFELADDLPLVTMDPHQLEEILTNLVANASEATGAGGHIMVRTLPIGDVQEPTHVAVEIADDGPGMDETTRTRAFDPFFSTKFTGRGLGLAVVFGNVRAHQGTVTVETRPEHGSTFRIELPVTKADAKQEQEPPARLLATRSGRGSGLILVADDEEILRRAVGASLKRIGFEVCFAADGIEALALIRTPPGVLRAVVLDVMMPRLDGAATLRELRKIAPTLPVILTSGYTKDDVDAETLALANGFLTKPFASGALRDQLLLVLGDS